jgi:hypothetical protein
LIKLIHTGVINIAWTFSLQKSCAVAWRDCSPEITTCGEKLR